MSYEGWERDALGLEEALVEAHAHGLLQDHEHRIHDEGTTCPLGCIRGCGPCGPRLRALENLAGAEE